MHLDFAGTTDKTQNTKQQKAEKELFVHAVMKKIVTQPPLESIVPTPNLIGDRNDEVICFTVLNVRVTTAMPRPGHR